METWSTHADQLELLVLMIEHGKQFSMAEKGAYFGHDVYI